MSTMIVIGAGPVGRTVAEKLVGAHGSAYSEKIWRAELFSTEHTVLTVAAEIGVVVIFPESLYAYTATAMPMTEQSPRTATTGKRAVRAELLAARTASDTPTVSVVARDFFGPYTFNAHAGERMLTAVLGATLLLAMGSADQSHSFTYVPDLAGAYAAAAGLPAPKVGNLPGWLIRAAGLVHAPTRELAEMLYQFDGAFVLDSTHTEQMLGLTPTPLPEAAAATVAWWSERELGAPLNRVG